MNMMKVDSARFRICTFAPFYQIPFYQIQSSHLPPPLNESSLSSVAAKKYFCPAAGNLFPV
jgi:hypothetical protein